MLQRNYGQLDVMGQFVLCQLLYLSGPALAYAMLLSRRQLGIGFYHPAETLLMFVDVAAVERPELLPEVDTSFYVGCPADEAAFGGRLVTFASLKTELPGRPPFATISGSPSWRPMLNGIGCSPPRCQAGKRPGF